MSRYKQNKFISRLMVLLLCLMLLLAGVPVAWAAGSSACGENLSWTLSGNTLTISGSGDMWDFSETDPAPWYDYRGEIVWLSLPEGLTSIGDYAFFECEALDCADLPDSVTRVGEMAFYGCTAMRLLSISQGLTTIEKRAFERCWSLTALNLPSGLTTIEDQAFWRCHGLLSVMIPESVIYLGNAVFAYCDSMIQADVRASISSLPKWTFYGCDSLTAISLSKGITSVGDYAFTSCENLSTVRCSDESAERIGSDIQAYLDTFDPIGVVTTSGSSASASTSWESDGMTYFQTDTVTQTENASTDTSVITSGTVETQDGQLVGNFTEESLDIQIESAISNEFGWQELLDTVDETLEKYEDQLEESGKNIQVTVSLLDGSEISSEQMADLAGKPVDLIVQDISGSSWTVDCSTLDAEDLNGDYDLSYTIAETIITDQEAEQWYSLSFASDLDVNTEVSILLPTRPARQTATLYQKNGNSLTLIQAVVVDDNGYAHFYLANVDHSAEYIIGVDAVSLTQTDAIVPENLSDEYDIVDSGDGIEYVVTGRSSSWGISFGQVTGIMVIVLVIVVVIVGVVMYVQSKRKQQLEYLEELRNEHK